MIKNKRNSSIEALRLFFMLGIVIGHVYCHGAHLDFQWIYNLCKESTNLWNMPLYTLGTIGVTGFMFITGYYGLSASANKMARFLCITMFYGLVGMIYSGFSLRKIILLPLSFDLWWFVSCYIILLLISPILTKGIEMTNRSQLKIVVLGLIVYTYVLGYFNWANSRDFVFLFTIYMVARYTRLYQNNRLAYFVQRYGGGVVFAVYFLIPIILVLGGVNYEICMVKFLQNNNPMILISCMWLILMAVKHSTYNHITNYLASSSLAIYLITEYPSVRYDLCPALLSPTIHGWGLFIVLAICLTCILFDKLREKIFEIVICLYKKIQLNGK